MKTPAFGIYWRRYRRASSHYKGSTCQQRSTTGLSWLLCVSRLPGTVAVVARRGACVSLPDNASLNPLSHISPIALRALNGYLACLRNDSVTTISRYPSAFDPTSSWRWEQLVMTVNNTLIRFRSSSPRTMSAAHRLDVTMSCPYFDSSLGAVHELRRGRQRSPHPSFYTSSLYRSWPLYCRTRSKLSLASTLGLYSARSSSPDSMMVQRTPLRALPGLSASLKRKTMRPTTPATLGSSCPTPATR